MDNPPLQKGLGTFFLAISVIVTMFGTSFLLVWESGRVVDRYWPWLNRPHKPSFEEIVIALLLLPTLVIGGLLLGSAIWLLIMRPFVSRERIRPFFFSTEVPVFSVFYNWLFNSLYPEKQ